MSDKHRSPSLDLRALWAEAHDIPSSHVRETIKKLVTENFRHEADESRWNELPVQPHVYHECMRPHLAQIIDEKILKEVKTGRYICNSNIPIKARIPIFLKQEGPNKWRLIPNYSYKGNKQVSVNDLVPYAAATVELPTTKDMVKFVHGDGKNQYIGKNDFQSCFRQIPMNPIDWSISVYRWRGIDWIDTRMPWGGRRSAKVAHHLSLAITYVAYKYIPPSLQPCILDYVDDHIFATQTPIQCIFVHLVHLLITQTLGMPVKKSKTVLVAQIMQALGFTIDMIHRWVEVTQKKITNYSYALIDVYHSKTKTAKEMQAVAGKLQSVAFIKYPLRCYLRDIYKTIPAYNAPSQIVTVTPEIRNACIAWIRALQIVGGRSFERVLNRPTKYDQTLTTDASNLGYGGFVGTHWYYGAWFPDEVKTGDQNNIRERELYSPLIAAYSLAEQWDNQVILLKIDNMNAKDALAKKSIASETAQKMVIRICEMMIKYNFELYVEYVDTKTNALADSLSRLQIQQFKQKCQQMNKKIDPAPLCLVRIPFQPGVTQHAVCKWPKVVYQ